MPQAQMLHSIVGRATAAALKQAATQCIPRRHIISLSHGGPMQLNGLTLFMGLQALPSV